MQQNIPPRLPWCRYLLNNITTPILFAKLINTIHTILPLTCRHKTVPNGLVRTGDSVKRDLEVSCRRLGDCLNLAVPLQLVHNPAHIAEWRVLHHDALLFITLLGRNSKRRFHEDRCSPDLGLPQAVIKRCVDDRISWYRNTYRFRFLLFVQRPLVLIISQFTNIEIRRR